MEETRKETSIKDALLCVLLLIISCAVEPTFITARPGGTHISVTRELIPAILFVFAVTLLAYGYRKKQMFARVTTMLVMGLWIYHMAWVIFFFAERWTDPFMRGRLIGW